MSNQKTVLITGANKGIGFQICRDLAKLGFRVFLSARNEERGKKATEELTSLDLNVSFLKMDVSNVKSISAAFSELKEQGIKLDILINNAGVLFDEGQNILKANQEESLEVLKINSLGALWVTQIFFPLLKKGSRIIMMSSGAGEFCQGISTFAPIYNISKTAMNAITRQLHLALEKEGIIINAMCPGWVRTDMGGSSASRSVEKGAETAVWLATEASENINGKFLRDKKIISW